RAPGLAAGAREYDLSVVEQDDLPGRRRVRTSILAVLRRAERGPYRQESHHRRDPPAGRSGSVAAPGASRQAECVGRSGNRASFDVAPLVAESYPGWAFCGRVKLCNERGCVQMIM